MEMRISYLNQNPFFLRDSFFNEFQQNLLRWIVFAGGLPMIVWQLFEQNRWVLFVCMVMMMLVFALTGRNLSLAGVVLYAGFSTIFMGLGFLYQTPAASLFLCLLPIIIAVCFGAAGGILATLAFFGQVWFLATALPGFSPMAGSIAAGGSILLLFGLFVRYWMVAMVRLYFDNYHRVDDELRELRQQRVEFKQVQEDLVHANNELARLTSQLKQLNQVAEEARMAKENFVAMVSHELRTPLNMIIGFSEVITQSPSVYGSKLPPSLLADISSIQHNSRHLLELVNDVLDLSQVDVGNLAISREWCTIQEIVDEAFEVIRPLFQSKGMYLKQEMRFSSTEQEQSIYCDKTRVREIIINLLSNAGRFTETGGVIVRAHYETNHVVVAVEDTGPGISPENQAKLFEPFQQLDSTIRRRYGGSGLGLAISKRFVELHGGKMWLESEVGQGTTFFFRLPINAGEAQALSPTSTRWVNRYTFYESRTRAFKAPVAQPKPRCIVLEEGQTLQHLLSRYLDGLEAIAVPHPDQLAQTLEQFPSQLLIINHPRAAELLTSLTSQGLLPVGLPVLAFWMPGGKDFSDTLNANRYLVKPVSNEVLLDAVASFGDRMRRILLVDDNPEIIQLFGRVLSSAGRGYQILRASDGEQALDLLRKRKPDLMILDLIMPVHSGFQVLEEKNSDPAIRGIPVLVITAQDPAGLPKTSQSITMAREGGFSSRDLIEMIDSLAAKSAGETKPGPPPG